MKIIGITGNIASGKSYAENVIKRKGFKVLDADNICHELLDTNEFVIEKVTELFFDFNILSFEGTIDRRKIAEIVFNDADYKIALENILHPLINFEIKKFIENNRNEKLIFISVPLLFETKMQNLFDVIILICADDNIRLQRLMKRNNLSESQALTRLNAQMPQAEKIKISDCVIDNNNDLISFENNILTALNQLL